MAVAYLQTGEEGKWRDLVDYLRLAQGTSGGMPAASRDDLTTGISLSIDESARCRGSMTPAFIPGRPAGSSSEQGMNPFWMRTMV